ncbi:replication initiation protein [Salmonella enterica]|nr:replication initiation protein [Salmonella enterica]EEH5466477.1 replication initiation protein [Salmonella enterica]EEH7555962.1 replication initiation protein [Salmonella enterica]EEO5640112.1 replication initiation protein [Salmonella enterica]EEQ0204221.1 replication initiation protein [Salmonella enterica]
MSNYDSDLNLHIEKINQSSGDIEHIISSSTKSIQPLSLLRLSVFTPVQAVEKGKVQGSDPRTPIDAINDFRQLEIVEREGYTSAVITGPKLDLDTDFKVWVGVVSAFTHFPSVNGVITMSFAELARFCDIDSRQVNKRLKERLSRSVSKLSSTSIRFTKQTPEGDAIATTHLIGSSIADPETNTVKLAFDNLLSDFYKLDIKRILKLKVLNSLKRNEVAKAIYTFLEGLPNKPGEIQIVSASRLMVRLDLKSEQKKQIFIIRKALKTLTEIGYLTYEEKFKRVNGKREFYYQILKRDPDLGEPVRRQLPTE